MNKNLFKEDIKTVAKRIVGASNGKFKQTEVLDLLAKADGYSGYNKEYRLVSNSQQEIEKILNEHFLSVLDKDKEILKNTHITDSHLDSICSAYLSKLKYIIQNFFRFKDGSSIDISYSYRYDSMVIYKKPFNIEVNFQEEFIGDTSDIISEIRNKCLLPKVSFPEQLLLDKANNMNIYKFIEWFKECFDLEYNPFNALLDSYNFNYPINKSIETNINKTFYASDCHFNTSTSDDVFKCAHFHTDVDYLIPQQNLKVRITYVFNESDLRMKHEDFLAYKQGLTNNMFSNVRENNIFAYGLDTIQITNLSDEFEFELNEDNTINEDKNIDDKFKMKSLSFYDNPKTVFDIVLDNKKLKQIVKSKNLMNFEIIKNALKEYDYLDGTCFYDEQIFKESTRDITYLYSIIHEIIRYILDCIDESLAKIMNNNIELLLTNIYSIIQEKEGF